MPETCELEVTPQERAIILLLRQTKYGRLVITKRGGVIEPIIDTQGTVDLRTIK